MNEAMPQWLNSRIRQAMLRFARLHIQPDEEAEDVVQDALLALTQHPERLTRAQDLRAYMFGVLKHKITDRLRHKYRKAAYEVAIQTDELDEVLFYDDGHWIKEMLPSHWNDPAEQMTSDAFFVVVDACIDHLPEKIARVFSMKEFLDCDTDEICAALQLSQAGYWQCMSRARKRLQLCLNEKWFERSA